MVSLELDTLEANVERDEAARRVVRDGAGGADSPVRGAHLARGGQRERGERSVEVSRREGRTQAQRSEPQVRDRQRKRRAGDRAAQRGDAGPMGRQRRHVLRVSLELHTPGACGAQRAVLDDDRDVSHGEALDGRGDGGATAAIRLPHEEIRDVELARARPDDPDGQRVEGAVHEVHAAPEDVARAEPRLQPIERRQGAAVAVHHAEAAQRDVAPEETELDGVERDRAARRGRQPPDGHLAHDLRQRGQTDGRDRHERGDDDEREPEAATTIHSFCIEYHGALARGAHRLT